MPRAQPAAAVQEGVRAPAGALGGRVVELGAAEPHGDLAVAHLDPLGRAAQPQPRARGDRRVGHRLAQLAEAAPRVEVRQRLVRQHIANGSGQRGQRGRRPRLAPRLLRVDLLAVDAPQLPGVRRVHLLVERRAEAGAHHLGVAVRRLARLRLAPGGRHGLEGRAGHRHRGQRAGQLARLERIGDPLLAEQQPAVPVPGLQIGAEQEAQVGQDVARHLGIQPVAAEVHPDPGDVEGGGHAPHRLGPIEYDDGQPAAGGPPRGSADRRGLRRERPGQC